MIRQPLIGPPQMVLAVVNCVSITVTGALVYFPVYFFAFHLSYHFSDADQSAPAIGRNLPNQDAHNTVGCHRRKDPPV